MKKKLIALALSAAMMASLAACGSSGAPAVSGGAAAPSGKTQILTIGTADSTGSMYPVGSGVASVINDNIPGFKVNVETSKGSPANCVNIQQGVVDLATIAADTAMELNEGTACIVVRVVIPHAMKCVEAYLRRLLHVDGNAVYVEIVRNRTLVTKPECKRTQVAVRACDGRQRQRNVAPSG